MRVRIPSERMIKIPLFARYFSIDTNIRMYDNADDRYDSVDIEYIYGAFKERFLQELEAEGYEIIKVDSDQPGTVD